MREVVVEPVGRGLGLADDRGHHRHDDEPQRSREAQEDDRDREAAREPGPLERPHDRVEQERDQRPDEEEKDDVTRRATGIPTRTRSRRGKPTSCTQRGISMRGGRPTALTGAMLPPSALRHPLGLVPRPTALALDRTSCADPFGTGRRPGVESP